MELRFQNIIYPLYLTLPSYLKTFCFDIIYIPYIQPLLERQHLFPKMLFVPKDVAIKTNLLLYRILNGQNNMLERHCFILISS